VEYETNTSNILRHYMIDMTLAGSFYLVI